MENFFNFIELHSQYFSVIVAALLSFFISLPKDLDPLSAIGLIFKQIAIKINLDNRSDSYKRLGSLLSISLIYFPIILIISQSYNIVVRPVFIDGLVLFILLSWHDKKMVYVQIIAALQRNNIAQAKFKLDSITQRQAKPLSLMGVNKATIESMLLQLSASWFAVLFWYLVAGIYAALLYRTIQICAQQWNSKNTEFTALSTFPSAIYSAMIFPVHLLISCTFSLYDKPFKGVSRKLKQSLLWHHFSSGLMLANFALGMQFQLGGVRLYGETKITYAALGNDTAPTVNEINLSLQRITLSAWFWLCCFTGYTFFPMIFEFMSL